MTLDDALRRFGAPAASRDVGLLRRLWRDALMAEGMTHDVARLDRADTKRQRRKEKRATHG